MLTTAGVVGLILVGLGELLSRLLHFTTGSLSIAGGLILVTIAVTMVLGTGDPQESKAIKGRDPMRIAVSPLAVPYLLNPAGIVTLVTLSAEADAASVFVMVVLLGRLDEAVKHVDVLVAGHGAVAEGPEVAARLAADRAYIDALQRGDEPVDARSGAGRGLALGPPPVEPKAGPRAGGV